MNRGRAVKKITKYKKYSFFNIGTLLFGTVFIYMLISTFMYLTETHVTAYEVQKGTITGNYRYHALALRSEQIVNATQSGSVRYYERSGNRASAGSVVCSINETGSSAPVSISEFALTSDDAARLQDSLSSFTINYSGTSFQQTYDLQATVEGRISEIIEENSYGYVSERNQCTAPESGFVLYNIDGFENAAEDELSSEMFDVTAYTSTNLRNQKTVTAGSPLFKMITDETWYLYFPIDNKLMTELTDLNTINIRFLKDNQTFSVSFSIVTNENGSFGKVTLNNSLVRYCTDRYLEIELIMNKKSGLKIPSSALVERRFYQIDEEFAIKNANTSSEIVLMVEKFAEDGSSSVNYVTATVYSYDRDTGQYMVDANLLDEGDVLLMENSVKQKQIQEKDQTVLYGVYNINKGYAVFREVTVIDENEEYCIIESNNIYSLAAYDYVALNADEVSEDQIVY